MAKTLLWCICGKAAWCGVEDTDKGGDDVFEKEGIVEVLEEVEQFFELECDGELCLGV